MTRSRCEIATLAAVLCTASAAVPAAGGTVAATAAGPTGTGGASIPQAIAPTTGGTGYGEPGTRALVVHPIALRGSAVVVRGTLPGAARRRIVLQRLDPRGGWRSVQRARVRRTTRFRIGWRADRAGPTRLRVVLAGRGAAAAGDAPVADVMVYRRAQATFYGPGFFGRQTACDLTLTPDLHGVAHRRLPCGTLVAITYADREITVPVVDRGPFSHAYSWDLTQATADALGFTGSGEIGYVRAEPPVR